MCGGCNILAESAGITLIMARYWWVARQGSKAVAEAESIVGAAASDGADAPFVDPLPELTRVT